MGPVTTAATSKLVQQLKRNTIESKSNVFARAFWLHSGKHRSKLCKNSHRFISPTPPRIEQIISKHTEGPDCWTRESAQYVKGMVEEYIPHSNPSALVMEYLFAADPVKVQFNAAGIGWIRLELAQKPMYTSTKLAKNSIYTPLSGPYMDTLNVFSKLSYGYGVDQTKIKIKKLYEKLQGSTLNKNLRGAVCVAAQECGCVLLKYNSNRMKSFATAPTMAKEDLSSLRKTSALLLPAPGRVGRSLGYIPSLAIVVDDEKARKFLSSCDDLIHIGNVFEDNNFEKLCQWYNTREEDAKRVKTYSKFIKKNFGRQPSTQQDQLNVVDSKCEQLRVATTGDEYDYEPDVMQMIQRMQPLRPNMGGFLTLTLGKEYNQEKRSGDTKAQKEQAAKIVRGIIPFQRRQNKKAAEVGPSSNFCGWKGNILPGERMFSDLKSHHNYLKAIANVVTGGGELPLAYGSRTSGFCVRSCTSSENFRLAFKISLPCEMQKKGNRLRMRKFSTEILDYLLDVITSFIAKVFPDCTSVATCTSTFLSPMLTKKDVEAVFAGIKATCNTQILKARIYFSHLFVTKETQQKLTNGLQRYALKRGYQNSSLNPMLITAFYSEVTLPDIRTVITDGCDDDLPGSSMPDVWCTSMNLTGKIEGNGSDVMLRYDMQPDIPNTMKDDMVTFPSMEQHVYKILLLVAHNEMPLEEKEKKEEGMKKKTQDKLFPIFESMSPKSKETAKQQKRKRRRDRLQDRFVDVEAQNENVSKRIRSSTSFDDDDYLYNMQLDELEENEILQIEEEELMQHASFIADESLCESDEEKEGLDAEIMERPIDITRRIMGKSHAILTSEKNTEIKQKVDADTAWWLLVMSSISITIEDFAHSRDYCGDSSKISDLMVSLLPQIESGPKCFKANTDFMTSLPELNSENESTPLTGSRTSTHTQKSSDSAEDDTLAATVEHNLDSSIYKEVKNFGVNKRDFMVAVAAVCPQAVPERYKFDEDIIRAYSRLIRAAARALEMRPSLAKRHTRMSYADNLIKQYGDTVLDDKEAADVLANLLQNYKAGFSRTDDIKTCFNWIKRSKQYDWAYKDTGRDIKKGIEKLYKDIKKYRGLGLNIVELQNHSGACPNGSFHEKPRSFFRILSSIKDPLTVVIRGCMVCNTLIRLPLSCIGFEADKAAYAMITKDPTGEQTIQPRVILRTPHGCYHELQNSDSRMSNDYEIYTHLMKSKECLAEFSTENSDDDSDDEVDNLPRFVTCNDKIVQITKAEATAVNKGFGAWFNYRRMTRDI